MTGMIRVLLVDDHELIRHGLARAFERRGDFEVVGQVGTVSEAISTVRSSAVDVVVTDVRLPDGSGLDIVRTLRETCPSLGLVVLTMYSGDDQLFAAMEAGASAFVGKNAPAAEVVAAAAHARIAPTTFTAANLPEAMKRRLQETPPRLSGRELEVLQLLSDGLGVRAIARRLYVSESTAKTHVSRIYEKLGAANRAQALMRAVKADLIPGGSIGPI